MPKRQQPASVEPASPLIPIEPTDIPNAEIRLEVKPTVAAIYTETGNSANPTAAAPKRLRPWMWFVGIGLLVVLSSLAYLTYQDKNTAASQLISQLGDLVQNRNEPVLGEEKDRVNILLLGIGGEGHDGGTLTDTIMVASIKPSTHQVALLSLPRDLIVKFYDETDPDYWEGHKINSAYALYGIPSALEKVSTVTGLKLQYYVVLDFSGFRQIIDDMDGVDVTVERDFVGLYGAKDLTTPCALRNLYHLDDGSYCAVSFTAGTEHMDGERALIYSRIRKLAPTSKNSEEGSDFARAQRQQKVLQAFKEKLFSAGTVVRPQRLTDILQDVDQHLETNLQLWEIARIIELAGNISNNNIIHKVVDDSPEGLVMTTTYAPTGASVVIPRAGDYNYSEIRQLAKSIFKVEPTEAETVTTVDASVNPTAAIVQVLNGTTLVGSAARTGTTLEEQGFTVSEIGNAFTTDYTTTKIYDLTDGAKPATVELLQTNLGAVLATADEVDTLLSLDPDSNVLDTTADFIIILGNNDTSQNSTP
ncbi:MAG: cell envelope-related transcriptional attenuator [uncultured bacterium]|nr:MAG: cell envelope-related transcriptional attenuator [uncultured bacterium]